MEFWRIPEMFRFESRYLAMKNSYHRYLIYMFSRDRVKIGVRDMHAEYLEEGRSR